jgi:hypothetical protein
VDENEKRREKTCGCHFVGLSPVWGFRMWNTLCAVQTLIPVCLFVSAGLLTTIPKLQKVEKKRNKGRRRESKKIIICPSLVYFFILIKKRGEVGIVLMIRTLSETPSL